MCVRGKVHGRTNGWSGLGVSEWGTLVFHLHCAAAVHHRCCRARGSAGGRRSDCGDWKLHLGRAGFLNCSVAATVLSRARGCFRPRNIRCGLDGLSITVSPGLISRPPSAGRIFMTPFSMVMVWTWHLALASLETQLSRSAVEPLLVIVEVAGAEFCSLRRCPRPWLGNVDWADIVVGNVDQSRPPRRPRGCDSICKQRSSSQRSLLDT